MAIKRTTIKQTQGVLFYVIRGLIVFVVVIFAFGIYYMATHSVPKTVPKGVTETKEILNSLKTALGQYYQEHATYPEPALLADNLKWEGKQEKGNILDAWDRKIIYSLLKKDADDKEKVTGYILFSTGPNGRNDNAENDGMSKDDIVIEVQVPENKKDITEK